MQLTRSEITFIVDLLLSICKYAQINNDKDALGLGAHLLSDFKEKTTEKLEKTIKNAEKKRDSELLMVLFDLRSKVFINKVKFTTE
jgi:hypothetical protein